MSSNIMEEGRKIKIVWLTHFSNERVRSRLKFARPYFVNIIRKLLGYPTPGHSDFAVWNTNAIKELEKYSDIDLTIIMPHYGISGHSQVFTIGSVKYICFRSQDDHLFPFIIAKLFHKEEEKYCKNRAFIKSIIQIEKPDIVHIIGAENPYYSIAALDIPDSIPTIVSLQTLLSTPDFTQKYPLLADTFSVRVRIEKSIIQKCTYIAGAKAYYHYILENIKKDAKYLDMPLALGLEIDTTCGEKEYDFVYFAANIQKACEDAVEAFALACRKYPNLKLNVSGGYDESYKKNLDDRLNKLGITNNVYFTGSKETHEEVLAQIKKSRFALLPLKIDLISSTIREAFACGLPVVTTITEGTPALNEQRQTVLLSKQGDYQAMANNMLLLIEDNALANQLRDNGIRRIKELHSNELFVAKWHEAYSSLIKK